MNTTYGGTASEGIRRALVDGTLISGNVTAVKQPFGAQVERAALLAAQLVDGLERIDGRIAGRHQPQSCETTDPAAPVVSLENVATHTVSALERCVELVQRISGDVGVLG